MTFPSICYRAQIHLVTFGHAGVRGPLFLCFYTCLFFQRHCDQATGGEERDADSGHLPYASGDVLEERCRFSLFAKRAALTLTSNLEI